MLDAAGSDAFPLCLLQHHVIGSGEYRSLLPTSYWGAQEELARLTQPTTGHVRLRTKPPDTCKYPASFDGSAVVIKMGDLLLELSMLCASIFTAPCTSTKAFMGIQEFRNHQRCWLFAVDTATASLPSIVQRLISAGAILVDILPSPKNVKQLSTGRTEVYCCPKVVFHSDGNQNDKSTGSGREGIRSCTDISNDSSEVMPSSPGESAPGGGELPLQEFLPQCSPPSTNSVEVNEDEEPEPQEIRWVTKFYNSPSPSGDDEKEGCMMLPEMSLSSSSQDGAPLVEKEVLKEFRILTTLQGTGRILKISGLFRMPDPKTKIAGWTLISDFHRGGPMTAYLKKHKMFEPDVKKIAYGLLAALEFMHQRAIAHRNIKLDHILLRGDSLDIVLCGFGSAHFLNEIDPSASVVGTLGYMAPETIQFNTSREPADMFAAGVVVFCSLSCHKPFGGSTPAELTKHSTIHKEVDFDRQKAFRNVSGDCKELIQQLLVKSPHLRFTAPQALEHAWLSAEAQQDMERRQSQKEAFVPRLRSELSTRSNQSATSSTMRVVAEPKRLVAEPKRLADVRAASSPKRAAAPSSINNMDEDTSPGRRRAPSGQSNCRRSRSVIQTIRDRAGGLFQALPFGRSMIRQYDDDDDRFAGVSPAQQQRPNPQQGEGRPYSSSARRALSAIRSVIPASGNAANAGSLENRPFTGLDAP
eukprot:TRINITY_DN59943_c0_g1_i1.p1 TRINITY_DN59943_c0_g1~~TRINITY_DN59943_c0_g1_i1.p1  ORF type:complete len:712 (-),score=95.47 TRINITY_DN59943_c0_g1_i1:129-2222(-)